MRTRTSARRLAAGASVLTLAGLLAAATVPSAALAADDKGNTVGEVVVTAQFREQSLQQTPIAITAVNAKMLEQRSQTSIFQVAAQAPNVTLKPAGAAFGPSLQASIRGVGQFDFNFALEPGVGMYVDDVYYSTLTGSVFDLLDLDRVEILRGPQGTLAGKNSIGGAVKLYSKKPTGEGGGFVEGTYGGLNRVDLHASADFALVPDQLFLRISGVSRHHDGYVTRVDYACSHPNSGLPTFAVGNGCKLGTEGGQSMNALRAYLRWAPSEKLDIDIIADVTNDNSEVQASTIVAARTIPWVTQDDGDPATPVVTYGPQFVPSDPYVTYSTFINPQTVGYQIPLPKHPYAIPPVDTLKAWGVSGDATYQLAENLSLRSITAFRYYSSDFAEDTDGSPLNAELVMNHVYHRQFSEEVRLNGNLGTTLDYTVGGFYFKQRNVNSNRVDLPYVGGIGDLLDFGGNDPVVSHNKSAFVHAVWHATDALNVSGGVRYTKEDKTYTFSRNNPDGTPNAILGGLNGTVGKFEGDNWDYRADVDYHFTPDVMGYAQFSTGFKGGGVNPRPFFPGQVQPFGPEHLDAFEVGLKNSLLDHRMRLNLSAFFNKYKDIQLTLLSCDFLSPFPGAPCALPINAGDADVKGFEAETELHPVDGLEIDGSLSYLDFKYKRLAPNTGVTFDMVTPQTPKWKWSVGAQYEIPMGSMGSLTPRVDVSYQDELWDNAVNSPTNHVAAYTIANARLTWRAADAGWQASLEVTNLTNKLYYYQVFDLYNLAGWENAQPAQPREWAVTVRKSF